MTAINQGVEDSPASLLPTPTVVTVVHIIAIGVVPNGRNRREHCQISRSLLGELGVSVGMQIRLTTSQGSAAVFTVMDVFDTSFPLPARQVIIYANSSPAWGTPDDHEDGGVFKLFEIAGNTTSLPSATCSVRNVPVSDSYFDGQRTHFFDEPTTPAGAPRGSLTEHLTRGSDRRLFALFPHGGDIDEHTGDQVGPFQARLSSGGASATLWECRGAWAGGGASRRWHITADDLASSSFPGLFNALLRRVMSPGGALFRSAVAFHGFKADDDALRAIVIGGRAPMGDKELVRQRIQDAAGGSAGVQFYLADPDATLPGQWKGIDVARYAGTSTDNLVNRICVGGGIQVEQAQAVRRDPALREAVARGVATAMVELIAGEGSS